MSLRQAMKRSREESERQAQLINASKDVVAPPVKKTKSIASSSSSSTYALPIPIKKQLLAKAPGSSVIKAAESPAPKMMTPKKAAAAAAIKSRQQKSAAAATAAATTAAATATTSTIVTEHTFDLITRNDYSLFSDEQRKKLIVAKKRDVSMCVCHDKEDLECGDEQCVNRGCKVECIIEMCGVNLANDGRVCQNSRIQQDQRADIEVFDAGDKGRGLRARADLPAGTFLLEYVGEVVNERVLKKRLRRYERAGLRHRYIMEIDKVKRLCVVLFLLLCSFFSLPLSLCLSICVCCVVCVCCVLSF